MELCHWRVCNCSGGYNNFAPRNSATIGGGYENAANGDPATVPGGLFNETSQNGHYSLAAGRGAKAYTAGTFVWSGSNHSSENHFYSVVDREFAVRCAGGARFVTQYTGTTPIKWAYLNPSTAQWEVKTSSDVNLKSNFSSVDSFDILNRLASMPIQTWSYNGEDTSIQHIGPTAQDFYTAFGMGKNDGTINTLDAEGVALAALKGLYEMSRERDEKIAKIEARLAEIEKIIFEQEIKGK